MKAVVLQDYGSVENFQLKTNMDIPKIGPTDVLIHVVYAGLRWGDIMGRQGIPIKSAKAPFVAGQEAAGIIAEIGANVTKFKKGDRVCATTLGGAYAEFVRTAESMVIKIPDNVSLDAALVYRVNLPTAYLVVHEWAKVQEGEAVLVHGASGGVGMLIVQILKRDFKNVTVIALAGSDSKCTSVKANGADYVINYKANDYVTEVEKIVGKKPRGFAPFAPLAGVHVCLNGVGGKTLQKDRLVIRRLGRWVLFGTIAGVEYINPFENAYDSIAILPFSMIPFQATDANKRAMKYADNWLRTQPLLSPSVYQLEQIAEVQSMFEQGKLQGKVVFSVAPENIAMSKL